MEHKPFIVGGRVRVIGSSVDGSSESEKRLRSLMNAMIGYTGVVLDPMTTKKGTCLSVWFGEGAGRTGGDVPPGLSSIIFAPNELDMLEPIDGPLSGEDVVNG